MNFEIYVKTSPLGKNIGIHWRKIDEHQNREEPPLLTQVIYQDNDQEFIVNDVIYQATPSLLIFRTITKILLELTAIECPKLSEQSERKVFTSIVWIGDNCLKNETIIRIIAYHALQNIINNTGCLWKKIEQSISFDGADNFRVDREIIDNYIEELIQDNQEEFTYLEPDINYSIEARNDDTLNLLSEDFKKYKSPEKWLPWNEKSYIKEGVLIAFTKYLDIPTILHQAKVWRGYAYNVKEPIILEKKTAITKTEPIPLKKNPSKLTVIQIIQIAIVTIIFFLLVP